MNKYVQYLYVIIILFVSQGCFAKDYFIVSYNNKNILIGDKYVKDYGNRSFNENVKIKLRKGDKLTLRQSNFSHPFDLEFKHFQEIKQIKEPYDFNETKDVYSYTMRDWLYLNEESTTASRRANPRKKKPQLGDSEEKNLFVHENEVNKHYKEYRVALIIGNSFYKNDFEKVPTCTTSAMKVARKLRALGFHTIVDYNKTKVELDSLIDDLCQNESDVNNIKIVYYVGHGIRIGTDDYLVPVDGIKDDASTLIRISDLASKMNSSNSKFNLFFIDACRDGSEDDNNKDSTINILNKTWIVASSRRGKSADAGEIITPFTKAFLNNVDTHNKNCREIFDGIISSVRKLKGGQQLPEIIEPALNERLYLTDMFLNRISYSYIGAHLSYQFTPHQIGVDVIWGRQMKNGLMLEVGFGTLLPKSERISVYDNTSSFISNSYKYLKLNLDIVVGYEITLMNKWIHSITPNCKLSNALFIGSQPSTKDNSNGKFAYGLFFTPSIRFGKFVDKSNRCQLYGSVGVQWNPNKKWGDKNFQHFPSIVPFKECSGITEFGVNIKL